MNNPENANLLAIDTSTKTLALGLRFGGDRLIKSSEMVEKSHGQLIIKKIGELFKSAAIKKQDLNAIVVCTGPGSFTGLRIGLAAAKGMAQALDIPIIDVSTFEMAAYQLRSAETPVHVIVPLNRDECIVGKVEHGCSRWEQVSIVRYEALPETIRHDAVAAVGFDIAQKIPGLTNEEFSSRVQPDAADLLYLGGEKLIKGQVADILTLEPRYLQKSQAEIRFEQNSKKQ